MTKLFKSETINSRRAMFEFVRALWHLRSLLFNLLLMFLALCVAMFFLGAPVDSATRAAASFGETVYFCGVTALTIGYGDIVATSDIGRVLAILLGLHGLLVTGVTTAVAVFAVQRTVDHVFPDSLDSSDSPANTSD